MPSGSGSSFHGFSMTSAVKLRTPQRKGERAPGGRSGRGKARSITHFDGDHRFFVFAFDERDIIQCRERVVRHITKHSVFTCHHNATTKSAHELSTAHHTTHTTLAARSTQHAARTVEMRHSLESDEELRRIGVATCATTYDTPHPTTPHNTTQHTKRGEACDATANAAQHLPAFCTSKNGSHTTLA